jgi:predicted transcriptional regulator
VGELGGLIERVHGALAGLGVAAPEPEPDLKPAVSVRSSVKSDHIVCLEDGKKMKMLKRHLSTDHGMTPAEYRVRWNLPADYPMVAPAYAQTRRELAVKIGLGRKPGKRKAPAKGS